MSEGPFQHFVNPKDFRIWLEQHHANKSFLWLAYYKKHTGKASITWPESIEEALCFGWIDGLRKKIDEESYKVRFTPRRSDSIWSKKNIESVRRLKAGGRMQSAGLNAFNVRKLEKSGLYAFEQKIAVELNPAFIDQFKDSQSALKFFGEQPPGYRKSVSHWIMSAKKVETQQRRFDRLLHMSKRSKRINLLSPFGTSQKN